MTESESLAIEDLARSGISPDAAAEAGMAVADSARDAVAEFHDLPALVIPYFDPITGEQFTYGDGKSFCRVRYLQLPEQPKGFVKKRPLRYTQPKGSPVRAYFPRTDKVDWKTVLQDAEQPIIFTEGEKKALKGCLEGLPVVGLGGVYNFMASDRLLPELDAAPWDGRSVFICYDSDAANNPDIQAAEGRLATELSLKRGAKVFLVRLPQPGRDKVGLDDFLVKHGRDKLIDLLEAAPQMRKADAAVLGLNDRVAWIEHDGMVLDLATDKFMLKANFVSGSQYSALELLVPTVKGDGVKRVSVAETWLTHPHAKRYSEIVFRPDTLDRELTTDKGGRALNLWRGWEPEEGDVAPFLELNDYLFSDMPADVAGLPLKLIAYKAQNPGKKIPLAVVIVGEQGCGKSMWAGIVRKAFGPYGIALDSHALLSPFNGWVERSLVCVIDEAQSVHLTKGSDRLKNLISEPRQFLNEKHRVARQVSSYTTYILTSNDRKVGSYSADDRRMIVVSAPKKREDAFYARIGKWSEEGGPQALLGYLLSLDLKGWEPPKMAPMTAEKYMAYMENLTVVQRLAEEMKTATAYTVKLWLDATMQWANVAELEQFTARAAKETKAAISRIQIRPFYTPEEIAMMFPAIVGTLHGAKAVAIPPAGEISRQLRESGIGYLKCKDDPRGFKWRGMLRQYLIIAEPEEWSEPITQAEFERLMAQFPSYAEYLEQELQENVKRGKRKHKESTS